MKKVFAGILTAALIAVGLVGSAPAQAAPPSVPGVGSATRGGNVAKVVHQGYKGLPRTGFQTNSLGPVQYFYAGGRQNPATPPTIVSGLMTVGNPTINPANDYHTLFELAVETSNQQNIVEVGWTKDQTTFGDTVTRLFVYHWINGVPQGYNAGFTNYSGRTYTVGQDISSFVGGADVQFGVQYFSGAWWVSFNGTWLGSFAGTRWSTAVPAVTFTSAPFIQAFGEVAGGSATPCADMGVNPPVLATTTTGAKIGSLAYDNATTGVSLTKITPTNAAWYNGELYSGSVRSLHIGGPASC